ncbi:TetR/AcrR family transcriptional regulator [Vibrio metschnikovii]|nr:TetR/AcrR family transcriptional regulator [Vibrio metschnikovii]
MPKRSKEDTEITIQRIMDAVIDQLLRLGYDKMSYTTLSQQTGVSRTGISHHFPKKTDFSLALESKIFHQFTEHLELEQGLNEFAESWLKALRTTPAFMATLRLLFQHVVMAERAEFFSAQMMTRLYKLVDDKWGPQSRQQLEWLIGKSIIAMSELD